MTSLDFRRSKLFMMEAAHSHDSSLHGFLRQVYFTSMHQRQNHWCPVSLTMRQGSVVGRTTITIDSGIWPIPVLAKSRGAGWRRFNLPRENAAASRTLLLGSSTKSSSKTVLSRSLSLLKHLEYFLFFS